MPWISGAGQGVRIQIRVQPRSAKNEIVGVADEYLKVKLTAPPVDGEANRMLRKFLGEVFGCGAGNISLLRGETGRVKLVEIKGLLLKEAISRISGLTGQNYEGVL